jgi:selT/selW/selH-like putative selenoprotein
VRERLEKKAQVNIKLVRGFGGVFEITIDNNLVFSKKALGRFPTDEEVDQFVPG